MAGQGKDRVLRRTLIGLDPGERWTGFAVLQLEGRENYLRRVETGVIDGESERYRAVDVLQSLIHHLNTVVVAEDYHVRPVGHQRFTRGLTLRLIGALEYSTQWHRAAWLVEQAGDPAKELDLLGLSVFIADFRDMWPKPGKSEWHHALSAWRVLGRYLLRGDPSILRRLAQERYTMLPALGCDVIRRPLWASAFTRPRKLYENREA